MGTEAILRVATRLKSAERVAVLTGAGVSAESGIATFRDPEGLWSRFRPEELASMDAFLANPDRVQDWYAHRRQIVDSAEPNAGHIALADLERHFESFTLITQNVDGLHQRAGSEKVLELHGSLRRNYCVECGEDAEPARLCGACGGRVRPDVVWFGEMLPEDVVQAAFEAAESSDVFLSIGTSAVVHPAAGLPVAAAARGAFVAEINVERSAVADRVHTHLTGPAGTVLPELLAALQR